MTQESPSPFTLSLDDQAAYRLLADGIVQQTLLDYDHFSKASRSHVDPSQWKSIKTHENLTVYKQRGYKKRDKRHYGLASPLVKNKNSMNSAISSVATIENWTLPPLLIVGTMEGTLDDVMYGLTTPDASAMLLKAAYTQEEMEDGTVLADIDGPTPQEPYRFVGIKWMQIANPSAVRPLVRDRDFVVLESTGILTRPNSGDRMGFVVVHSINPPACSKKKQDSMSDRRSGSSIQRALFSSCYLFRQLPHGLVEVYLKTFVEARGKIVKAVTLASCANWFLYCRRAYDCAQHKKLVWLLDHANDDENQAGTSVVVVKSRERVSSDNRCCGVCSKALKGSTVNDCALCRTHMCTRCSVDKTIYKTISETKHVTQSAVKLCKTCLATVHRHSTFDIARKEVLSGRFGYTKQNASSSPPAVDRQKLKDLGNILLTPSTRQSSPIGNPATNNEDGGLQRITKPQQMSGSSFQSNRVLASSSEPIQQQQQQYVETAMANKLTHQRQLLMRMTQLQLAADTAYQSATQVATHSPQVNESFVPITRVTNTRPLVAKQVDLLSLD